MKLIRNLSLAVAAFSLVAGPVAAVAADTKKPEVRPYKLETCAVTGEKLGDMGKPYVFEYEGQEIKLCCKSCKKGFDKNPKKVLKEMAEAEKKAAKAGKKAEKAAEKDSHTGHNH